MLTEIVINLIRKKLSFPDFLLNLFAIFDFLSVWIDYNLIACPLCTFRCWRLELQKGDDPLQSELWHCIEQTCSGIIARRNKRDWTWLKSCIIPSKIWFTEAPKKRSKEALAQESKEDEDAEDSEYLYYRLLSMVENEAAVQLGKLKVSLGADADKDRDAWQRLVQWNVPAEKLTVLRHISDAPLPRQDSIPNGVVSEFSREELNYDATNSKFDGAKFYDLHSYLDRLSLLAQIVDDDFQTAVKQVFNVKRRHDGDEQQMLEGDSCLYKRGPVKLLKRAQAKAENDYSGMYEYKCR